MNMRISQLNGANSAGYYDRLPEKLVLEGYRRWTAGFETGSIIPWEMAWGLYTEALGRSEAKRAIAELSQFIRVLWHCASCPLRAFPFDSHHVCREECLTLGLISGLQNQDGLLLETCIDAIACKRRCDDVAEAARNFADTLADFGQTLLPIPIHAIDSALNTPHRATFH
ncbi:hypothetical protein KUG47_01805 [Falsochrobactrum sp. TDYN1]|uniref:Uncharacterized protein n=1 Tax=Falsochrobactrum tianjinense TaxID=2706015 RepID=A0A949USB6_9HYPH|nr:hypothetical protein [Falsochrobactrum sp. TDYN1]MBV2142229.1 hypothetical protein [Falsochrobactrum sp. TDYN1]